MDPDHSALSHTRAFLGAAEVDRADDDTSVSGLRPYLLTSGRAEPVDQTLEIEAQVLTTEPGAAAYRRLSFEYRAIVELCLDTMSVAAHIDRTGEVPDKTSTTGALDFGCRTIDETLKLYLFGTPGQDRFGFMWHDLSQGALGALVIVDARRIDDCFPAVDYFEKVRLPFVVAVNMFNGELSHDIDDVRWALAIDAAIPVITFDARNRLSVR